MPRQPFTEFTLGDGDPDDHDETQGSATDSGHAASPPAGPNGWRAILPWVGCAVVLVLLGVLLAPSRPPEVSPWGQVADLTTEPEAAWSIAPTDGAIRSALIADGMLITVRAEDIQGREPGTGAVVWTEEASDARCTTDGTSLTCVDADSRVLQLDPASGDGTTREIPEALLATRAEGDLFVLTAGEQPAVQRLSGEQTVWSTRVHLDRGSAPYGVELTVLAGHVLTTRATAAAGPREGHGSAYDAATGEWLAEGAPHNVTSAGPGVWQLMGADGGRLFVRGADGPQQLAHVPLGFDDAWSGPEQVAFRPEPSSGVLDVSSGEWRWQTDEPLNPIARLTDVLISRTSAQGAPAIQGRDAGTGEVLWQRAETWLRCPCLADESTLAAFQVAFSVTDGALTTSGDEVLVGVDAGTGELRWQLDLPGETFTVLTDGDHLIAVSPQVVRGWDLG